MPSSRQQQVEHLFHGVIALPLDKREAFLEEHVGADAELRSEIESLLRAHESSEPFLENPAAELLATALPSLGIPFEGPHRIGCYQVVRKIAEGGMGTVYEARQEHPRRTVALKVMKQGSFSPSSLRRFELESEILGRLQHPGIAQIYEAGTQREGSHAIPYFAMEFVTGTGLVRHAQQNGLSIGDRLESFAKVCDAVEHGHQHGVVHRDLKPANILVDATGQPKVIDFGIARATDSDIQRTTLQTDVGQLLGTLAYMSPEQLSGDPARVNAASDVYSLGVVCYELLTNRLPHDVTGKSIPDAIRAVHNDEPTRPGMIDGALRGDIDTMLAKALEKDPARRYPSAAALAADIRRYLTDRPISARPPSAYYQFRKFSRRNKALVVGVSVAFFGLCVGSTVATWKAIEAVRERNRALEAEDAAKESAQVARAQRLKAERVNTLLTEMLVAADPALARGRDVTVREVLDRLAEQIADDPSEQPEVIASLHDTIGNTYRSLGLYEKAESQLREALRIRAKLYGGHGVEALHSANALALTLRDLGRKEEAEELGYRTLESARTVLSDEDSVTLSSMNLLALLLQDRGALTEAMPLFRAVLQVRERVAGKEDPATLTAMNNLAWCLWSLGQTREAGDYFRQVLALRHHVSGDDHPETLRTMINLAGVLRELGELNQAENVGREAVEGCQTVLGEQHAMTHYAMDRLAWIELDLGKKETAEDLARRTLELRRRALGEDHPHTLYSYHTLGTVLNAREKYEEAERYHRFALESRRHLWGDEHPDTVASLAGIALALRGLQQLAESESLHRRILEIRKRVNGEKHPDSLGALYNLALLLEENGQLEEADRLLAGSVGAFRETFGKSNTMTLRAMRTRASIAITRGNLDEAEAQLREIVVLTTEAPELPEEFRWDARLELGSCLLRQGQYAEAARLVHEAYSQATTFFGPNDPRTVKAAAVVDELQTATSETGSIND